MDSKMTLFSSDELKSLTAYQLSDYFHPYTCCDHQIMTPTPDGLVCPKCKRVQGSVLSWILDGSWWISSEE